MESHKTPPRTLSRFESTPTEIVQQVAAYLFRESKYHTRMSESDGLIELRATSRAMRAKIEHVFKQLFNTKILIFDLYTLSKLVELSRSAAYSPIVKTLVFVPPPDTSEKDSPESKWTEAVHRKKLEAALEGSPEEKLRLSNAIETSSMIFAFNRLPNLIRIQTSPRMQLPCPAEVRKHNLSQHAPTMIMAAIVQSGASLEEFDMADRSGVPIGGMNPRVLNNFALRPGLFTHLKLLRLKLTSRCLGQGPYTRLSAIIALAINLQDLSLTMDEASTAMTAPVFISASHRVWAHISLVKLGTLRKLELVGWDVPQADLQYFLTRHKDTLTTITLNKCVALFGDSKDVFRSLLGSKTLRCLSVRQFGEGNQRVYFPMTCVAVETPLRRTDWLEVAREKYTTTIQPWQNWDDSLNELIDDLAVSNVLVDPAADDAGQWIL